MYRVRKTVHPFAIGPMMDVRRACAVACDKGCRPNIPPHVATRRLVGQATLGDDGSSLQGREKINLQKRHGSENISRTSGQ